MTDMKMVESLWSLANGVTSFAVIQALAFLYALGRKDFVNAIADNRAQVIIVLATLAFTVGYCYAVWKCKDLVKTLDCHHEIWSSVTTGRIACIVVFNLMVLSVDLALA